MVTLALAGGLAGFSRLGFPQITEIVAQISLIFLISHRLRGFHTGTLALAGGLAGFSRLGFPQITEIVAQISLIFLISHRLRGFHTGTLALAGGLAGFSRVYFQWFILFFSRHDFWERRLQAVVPLALAGFIFICLCCFTRREEVISVLGH